VLRQKGCRNKREECKERGGQKEQGQPRGKDPIEAIQKIEEKQKKSFRPGKRQIITNRYKADETVGPNQE